MAKGKYDYWLTPEGLLKLEGWARDGLIDEQIAQNMGVSRSTLNAWKDKYPDISDTLKRGKEVVDYMVENALLKRALGYTYEERKYATIPVSASEVEKVLVEIKTKEVPPDTTAQIFWLKNRRPDKWRDKINNELIDESKRDDDGFLEALKGTAAEDWNEQSDI